MKDDLIRRSDAIKAVRHISMEFVDADTRQKLIEAIPSADRPQGEWIEVDDVSIRCRCSVCGWEAHLYEDDVYGMPYCPNCGARMKGAYDEA